MKHIEHIGIAVKDLAAANEVYTQLMGSGPYKEEAVEGEGVCASFFKAGGNKIELLAANNANSPISKYIAKRGEGIHHIAFAVDDIKAEMARLSAAGFQLVSSEPLAGADNKLVCFVHPKTTNGVLVELCQEKNKA